MYQYGNRRIETNTSAVVPLRPKEFPPDVSVGAEPRISGELTQVPKTMTDVRPKPIKFA